MVGLIVPELQNPIFPALAEVVAGALAQRGFNAVLCTRTGSMSEAEYVEMLLERQVSGMIFAEDSNAEATRRKRTTTDGCCNFACRSACSSTRRGRAPRFPAFVSTDDGRS